MTGRNHSNVSSATILTFTLPTCRLGIFPSDGPVQCTVLLKKYVKGTLCWNVLSCCMLQCAKATDALACCRQLLSSLSSLRLSHYCILFCLSMYCLLAFLGGKLGSSRSSIYTSTELEAFDDVRPRTFGKDWQSGQWMPLFPCDHRNSTTNTGQHTEKSKVNQTG